MKGAEATPDYPLIVMALIKDHTISPQIRLSGALALKNFVRAKWENEEELKEDKRDAMKQHALDLMLSTSGSIQNQISGMIAIICEFDFHQKWPQLLPVCILSYHIVFNTNLLIVTSFVVLSQELTCHNFSFITNHNNNIHQNFEGIGQQIIDQ